MATRIPWALRPTILWSLCMYSAFSWTVDFDFIFGRFLFAFCCRLSRCRCPVCRVCIWMFCISCPMMHKNSQPFSTFRWQCGNAPSQPIHIRIGWNRNDNRTRAIFVYFIFISRCAPFAWIVMTKTFGYLKGHMSFWSMPAKSLRLTNAHTHASTS